MATLSLMAVSSIPGKEQPLNRDVTEVVMRVTFRVAAGDRKQRLRSIHGLRQTLFVNRKNNRPVRRIHVQTNNVANLLRKHWVVPQFDGLRPMQLESKGLSDAMDGVLSHPCGGRHAASAHANDD